MTKEQLLGAVRHALTFAAGVAISKGYIDSSTATEITAGVVAIIGFVWSWRSKKV